MECFKQLKNDGRMRGMHESASTTAPVPRNDATSRKSARAGIGVASAQNEPSNVGARTADRRATGGHRRGVGSPTSRRKGFGGRNAADGALACGGASSRPALG